MVCRGGGSYFLDECDRGSYMPGVGGAAASPTPALVSAAYTVTGGLAAKIVFIAAVWNVPGKVKFRSADPDPPYGNSESAWSPAGTSLGSDLQLTLWLGAAGAAVGLWYKIDAIPDVPGEGVWVLMENLLNIPVSNKPTVDYTWP